MKNRKKRSWVRSPSYLREMARSSHQFYGQIGSILPSFIMEFWYLHLSFLVRSMVIIIFDIVSNVSFIDNTESTNL